jgi:hypothetical protein
MRTFFPVALASAFTLSSLPAQAFPGASVNLVRIDGDGVRALPLPSSMATPGPASQAPGVLLSQAGSNALPRDVTYLVSGNSDFVIRFAGPLPETLSGFISIRRRASSSSDLQAGEEVERIPLDSPNVQLSEDRRTLTITHDVVLRQGETFCALLPEGPYVLPNRITPCCFTLGAGAVSTERRTTPCALAPLPTASNPFPWWVVPAGLGIGVVICAAAGCFSGGGGGGTGQSSR